VCLEAVCTEGSLSSLVHCCSLSVLFTGDGLGVRVLDIEKGI
jgi:hypothetical protein